MGLKQSVCVPAFTMKGNMKSHDVIKAAAKIGFDAIEFWDPVGSFEADVALAKENGMVCASFIGHGDCAHGLTNRDDHDRIESEVVKRMELAVKHGVPGMICFSGNRIDGMSDEDAKQPCIAGLKRLAPYAEKKGVNLNFELLNSKRDHKGYQCDKTAWGRAVIEAVNSPRVKLLYDIYHMQIMEGDIVATIRDNAPLFGHVHTAGNPGRHEIGSDQELNYAPIAKALAAAGYKGYVGHEFFPVGDPVAALKEAYAIFDV